MVHCNGTLECGQRCIAMVHCNGTYPGACCHMKKLAVSLARKVTGMPVPTPCQAGIVIGALGSPCTKYCGHRGLGGNGKWNGNACSLPQRPWRPSGRGQTYFGCWRRVASSPLHIFAFYLCRGGCSRCALQAPLTLLRTPPLLPGSKWPRFCAPAAP